MQGFQGMTSNGMTIGIGVDPAATGAVDLGQGADGMAAAGNLALQGYVGREVRIHGLTSARGAEINGSLGQVIGFTPFPEPRLHVRIPGFANPFKLRVQNPLADDIEPPAAPNDEVGDPDSILDMFPAPLLRASRMAMDGPKTAREQLEELCNVPRLDMAHRARVLVDCLDALERGDATSAEFDCGLVTEEALRDPFVANMLQMKPPCVGGGKFKLKDLTAAGASDTQAALRLAEFPASGFCVACQRAYLENA